MTTDKPLLATARIPAIDDGPATAEMLALKYGHNWREHVVPEPDAFPTKSGIGDFAPGARNDTPPERRGPRSPALSRRIASSCAGHASPPTPLELYQAIHTGRPSVRSAAVLRMWMTEGTTDDLIEAWVDHCYTWRQLAESCQRHFIRDAVNADILNRMRRDRPELGTCRTCRREPAHHRSPAGIPLCTECGAPAGTTP